MRRSAADRPPLVEPEQPLPKGRGTGPPRPQSPASFAASPARERPWPIGGESLDRLCGGHTLIVDGALSGWGVVVGKVVSNGPCDPLVARVEWWVRLQVRSQKQPPPPNAPDPTDRQRPTTRHSTLRYHVKHQQQQSWAKNINNQLPTPRRPTPAGSRPFCLEPGADARHPVPKGWGSSGGG